MSILTTSHTTKAKKTRSPGKQSAPSLTHHYRPDMAAVTPVPSVPIQTPGDGAPLDTLAQLRKLARNKYIVNGLIYRLVDLPFSTMRQQYWNTFHCARVLDQENQTLSGKYCNARWCTGCNRIRTAKLINGYSEQLNNLDEKYFVTLTTKTLPGNGKDLKDIIELMHKNFHTIKDCMRKRKTPIIGIRKLECTFKPKENKFHPHYHLIVQGKEVAESIIQLWLLMFKDASRAGQDMKPADSNSTKELFKYFTKMITEQKNDSGDSVRGFHVESLDVIFTAMKGKRVFQPMGIKKVSEDVQERDNWTVESLTPQYKSWMFDDAKGDFLDRSGQTLTGFVPSPIIKQLRGIGHEVDWQKYEEEFKAIKRFDQREYWKERSEYWSNKITEDAEQEAYHKFIEDRNKQLYN